MTQKSDVYYAFDEGRITEEEALALLRIAEERDEITTKKVLEEYFRGEIDLEGNST